MDFNRIVQLFSYLGIFLLLIFKKDTQSIKFPKYLLFYLLFIFYVFFSEFFKLDRTFEIKYLFSNSLIGGFNFMFIIENISIPKKYYDFILSVSWKILLIAVLVIIFQQAIDPSFFLRMDRGELGFITEANQTESRLFSIYSWSGGFTAIGFSFVPIFLLIVEHLHRNKKNIIIWIILGLIFSLLTKARWIMLNTLLVFSLFFLNKNLKLKNSLKYIILVPIVVVSSFYILKGVGIDIEGIINTRILESDKRNLNEKTASTRLLAFKAFNELYWDNPFFGKGDIKYGMAAPEGKQDYKLSRFLRGRSSQIHVGYLSLFYLYGLVGAILFLSFLFMLLKRLYNDAIKTNVWAPFLGFLGFAVANLTLVSFEFFHMGFIIAFLANKYYTQENNEKIMINA